MKAWGVGRQSIHILAVQFPSLKFVPKVGFQTNVHSRPKRELSLGGSTSRALLPTTYAAPACGYFTWQAESLSQIQFLLAHILVETTERYIDCKETEPCGKPQRRIGGHLRVVTAPSETASRVDLSSRLERLILAPATTSPPGSFTTPTMLPNVD